MMTSLLNLKDENTKKRYQNRMAHIVAYLGLPEGIYEFPFINDKVLSIIEIKKLNKWIYVTNGLSEIDQPEKINETRIELIAYSKKRNGSIKELMSKIAEYPFQHQEDLCVWDTIPAPLCDLGFPDQYGGIILTPPSLAPSDFEYFKVEDRISCFLCVQGITKAEIDYSSHNGGKEIGEKIFRLKAPWLDKARKSIC